MAEGRSNQAIADRMVITQKAVDKHATNIFCKLGLHRDGGHNRRVLAVLTYLDRTAGSGGVRRAPRRARRCAARWPPTATRRRSAAAASSASR